VDLRDVFRILWRRLWVLAVVFLLCFGAMVGVRLRTKKDLYAATATYLLLPSGYDLINVYYQSPQESLISPLSIKDRARLLSSDRLLDEARQAMARLEPPILSFERPALQVGEDNSLTITARADTQEQAVRILEAYKQVIIDFDFQQVVQMNRRAADRVAELLDLNREDSPASRLRRQLEKVQRVREAELEPLGVTDLKQEIAWRSRQVDSVRGSLLASQADQKRAAHSLEKLKKLREDSALNLFLKVQPIPAILEPPPTIKTYQLRDQMRGLIQRLAEMKRRYTEEHPKVRDLRVEMERLQEDIQRAALGPAEPDFLLIQEEIGLHLANQEFLRQVEGDERKQIRLLQEKDQIVSREEELAARLKDEVDKLEVRRRELEDRLAQKPPNVEELKKVSVGLASVQFEASTWLMIGLVSLVLSVASAYLVEYLNDRIRTVADVKTYMNLPTIGLIPEFKGVPHNLMELAIKSPPYEYYNKLATFVEAALQDKGRKVLMITSAKEEEGKSSICANLGIALAQSGRRVAILDADMRKGRMESFFGVAGGGAGLSGALAEPPDAPMPALLATPVETLRLLPSGAVPANPLMLLRGERARRLLEWVEKEAGLDLVLVDTPPLMGVIDAAVVAAHGVPTVMVVQDNVVSRAEMNHVRTNLMRVGADVLGVILNKSRIEPETYYYYYPYRGYSA
jgi:capsular exopolysaccharide synthesis family protein